MQISTGDCCFVLIWFDSRVRAVTKWPWLFVVVQYCSVVLRQVAYFLSYELAIFHSTPLELTHARPRTQTTPALIHQQ